MSANCNCCNHTDSVVPVAVTNRPGLSTIQYRVGTQPEFKANMLARLSGQGQDILRQFTSRNNEDFTISLLDAFSVVADVLTFYQERIANESYLRTAKERLSVLQMARLIGYELRPGVAAATCVAFTLEDTPGALNPVQINNKTTSPVEGVPPLSLPQGIKIQSVPGPDEQAQTFETIGSITARAEWNAMRPRLTQQQAVTTTGKLVVLKGADNNVKQGDVLMIRTGTSFALKKVLKAVVDTTANNTTVYFDLSGVMPPYTPPSGVSVGNVNEFDAVTDITNTVVSTISAKQWKEEDLSTLVQSKKWNAFALQNSVSKAIEQSTSPTGQVFIFRKRASVFGYNAAMQMADVTTGTPAKAKVKENTIEAIDATATVKTPHFSWLEWDLEEVAATLYLDSTYDETIPNTYIAVQKATTAIADMDIYAVRDISQQARSAYGISCKCSKISLGYKTSLPDQIPPAANTTNWWGTGTTLAAIRNISVFVQSELLPLASLPITGSISGKTITLNRWYPGLKAGQLVALTGDRADLPGTSASEVMTLETVIVQKGFTVVTFTQVLSYTYVLSSVTINGNVAIATHGETVTEILGSGDASKAFQSFNLRQPPLTYISGASASGAQSTLQIWVNDLLWTEVPYFLGHTAEERIYITRQDDNAVTTVTFGDGITGARLPGGQENIKAIYRKGIGTGALVKANQLTQLLTRPLGVKSAANPIAATGAANAEQLENARANAPLTVLTLDRIVSLQDYEDFARAYAGISKALATWTWKGQRRNVFITIAGINGATVATSSVLYTNLLKSIRDAGENYVPLTMASYVPRYFRLSANVKIDAAYNNDKVLAAINTQLRAAFSFDARNFGQQVTASEVIAVIQNVPGVAGVDLDTLYRSENAAGFHYILPSNAPVTGDDTVFAAELLIIDPKPITINIIT
ncbi:putative baseplate assembly protein [Filimonas lacunae]|uniref:Putative baseplate assembly protein n=1 Tax=Filimonas lacunae TaxID=477680 RepID=A0A173MG40_9BACT|nr:putative baseplate assembly protein [Filimonas lacunae]BAV06594.1 hypothetical protein FLA_2613 [Filimonas lacunae]SIT27512.1 putative baseplate assembly protein [Filimonas lacunae]